MRNILHIITILLCPVFISSISLGCTTSIAEDEEAEFIPIRDASSLATEWNIVYGSEFSEEKKTYTNTPSSIYLSLQKNKPSYILAYPYPDNSEQQSTPYGAIFPFSTQITKEDGFAASILQELYCSHERTESLEYNINHFNWQKFMELCREYENPWLINRNKIITAIKKGKFKKSDIKIDSKRK